MALAVQISSYEELEKVIQDSEKEYDQERIRAAYQLAVEKHGDQKRSSGEPYIIHPLSVAAILVGLGMDSESVDGRAAARRGGGHRLHRGGDHARSSARRWPCWWTASPSWARSPTPPGRSSRRRTCGKC